MYGGQSVTDSVLHHLVGSARVAEVCANVAHGVAVSIVERTEVRVADPALSRVAQGCARERAREQHESPFRYRKRPIRASCHFTKSSNFRDADRADSRITYITHVLLATLVGNTRHAYTLVVDLRGGSNRRAHIRPRVKASMMPSSLTRSSDAFPSIDAPALAAVAHAKRRDRTRTAICDTVSVNSDSEMVRHTSAHRARTSNAASNSDSLSPNALAPTQTDAHVVDVMDGVVDVDDCDCATEVGRAARVDRAYCEA